MAEDFHSYFPATKPKRTRPTDQEIAWQLMTLRDRLNELDEDRELVLDRIETTQDRCPHRDVKTWTNNDGYGQFTVQRCNVCGLQKDGGL